MMWAWCLLRKRGRRWCSLPVHLSFDYKNVAQLVLRAEPSCLPTCVLHKHSCINKSTCNCCSVTRLCLTHCEPMECSTPGLPAPHHLQKFAPVHAHCIVDAIQPSHPLCPLLLLPSVFPSIRDFSNESAVCIRWPKYWTSASASVLPMSI